MTPKKSAKADLEGKRGFFFLIGIAIALTAAIITLQHESAVAHPKISGDVPTAIVDDPVQITVWKKDEPRKITRLEDVKNLPPEERTDDDPIFNIPEWSPGDPDDEDLKEIEELQDDLNNVETFDFIAIENIARPKKCEGVSNKEAQKECFNQWIQEYILTNTNYPEMARRMGLEDKVFVTFIISEEGNVEEVTIGRGDYELLNKEALRVLASLPQMTPGSQRGRNVKMKMTVPVNFRLSHR